MSFMYFIRMIDKFLVALAAFYLLAGCWCWYEMKHAPTDKELWGEELERYVMRNVMVDNPAGISRRVIFFIGNGNRFLCYLSLSASAHRKKVAAAFAAVLY